MSLGPMKKRMMLSFLIGFLIMLLIAAVGAVIFYKQYANVKEELAKAKDHYTPVLVAAKDYFADGKTPLDMDSFVVKEINTNTLPSEYYQTIEKAEEANSFEEARANSMDQHCLLWPTQKTVYPKIDIPEGTIVTMDMLWDDTAKITPDVREQEFNMILLPSTLKEGDYVDIRLLLPTGNDFVVASFLRVKKVTEGTVWFDLKELDTQYISSAIIESYLTQGSMLYAVKYAEPTLQAKAQQTYAVLKGVADLLFDSRFNSAFDVTELNKIQTTHKEKREVIEEIVKVYLPEEDEERREVVAQGIEERIQKQQAERATQIANGLFVEDALADMENMEE